MPDISMCLNRKCPSRNECYRYRAQPNEWRQSYAAFMDDPETGKCESFWPIEEATTPLAPRDPMAPKYPPKHEAPDA